MRKVLRFTIVAIFLFSTAVAHVLTATQRREVGVPVGSPEKVRVCHVPPAQPHDGSDGFVILVSEKSLDAHKAHGDCTEGNFDVVGPGGQCNCRDSPQVQVQISSPEDGSTVPERLVDVVGTIQPVPADPAVEVRGFAGTVDPSGAFLIPAFPLSDGENELVVQVFEGSVLVAEQGLTVFFFLPSDGSASVTPEEGGSAAVEDPDSPIFGAAIDIPPGAATRPLRAIIVSDPEHMPNLPVGEIPVGPPVSFGPEGEVFASLIDLTLPFDPALLPPGTDSSDIFVRALGDDGWETVPTSSLTSNTVTVSVDRLWQSPFIAVVNMPLSPGDFLVDTDPANATLYLNGVDTRLRTPALIRDVTPGQHEIKVYLPGFNEVFFTADVPPEGFQVLPQSSVGGQALTSLRARVCA